jgi:hypothetical protein
VPEVQNLDCSSLLVHAIVDVEGRMEKPPDVRVSLYRSADVWKGMKQFDVAEKIIGELIGRIGMIIPDKSGKRPLPPVSLEISTPLNTTSAYAEEQANYRAGTTRDNKADAAQAPFFVESV